jgi:hypothetical protein
MWSGQNWARWLLAPAFGAGGLIACVWGIIYGSGPLFLLGVGSLVTFSYLALSPSIYAFARHQREHNNLLQTLIVGAAFLLVLVSLGSALLAFNIHEYGLRAEGLAFAERSFYRVFVNRDPDYLVEHSSPSRKNSAPQFFIDRIGNEIGTITDAGPVEATFTSRLVERHLEMKGQLRRRVNGSVGSVWLVLQISRNEAEWEIDHISWQP